MVTMRQLAAATRLTISAPCPRPDPAPHPAPSCVCAIASLLACVGQVDASPPELLEARFTELDTLVLRFSKAMGPVADIDPPSHFRLGVALVLDDLRGGELTVYYDLAHHFADGLSAGDRRRRRGARGHRRVVGGCAVRGDEAGGVRRARSTPADPLPRRPLTAVSRNYRRGLRCAAVYTLPVHLRRIHIENVRSIRELKWDFAAGREAGWHVVLGNNGSGKSSVLRAIALGLLDQGLDALRQPLHRWVRRGAHTFRVNLSFGDGLSQGVDFGEAMRWSAMGVHVHQKKSFSCGFGPFRRLTSARKRPAPADVVAAVARHLSLFGENDEIVDGLEWLQELEFRLLKAREKGDEASVPAAALLPRIRAFINETEFLPHGAKLGDITPDAVEFIDGSGVNLAIDELSDGYRSTVSMTFELIRQLAEHFGPDSIWSDDNPPRITAPGVVLIDEIDAHLHPSWQREIGHWFTRWFPNIQFIVTTHSPLVCQAAEHGSILRLPLPGEDADPRVVTGLEFERLVYGDVLDAYASPSFDHVPTRSDAGRRKLERLASLNQKSLREGLSDEELDEREHLLRIMPSGRYRPLDAAE
jgi:hypothetical protein